MSQEFERAESSEILPQNFGDLTEKAGAPIAERASKRLEITRGTKNPYWKGVEETLEGMAGWFKAKAGEFEGKTVRAVAGAALVAELLSACSPSVSPKPIETITPNKPAVTETFTPTESIQVTPTVTSTATEVPTPTAEIKPYKEPNTNPYEFRNYVLQPDDLIPKEKGGIPDFERFLQSKDWPSFDESKIKTDVPMQIIYNEIYYNVGTSPNFPDRKTSPQQARVYFTVEMDGIKYFGVGIQLYDKERIDAGLPLRWAFGVDPNTPGYKYTESMDKVVIDSFMKDHYPIWMLVTTDRLKRADPLVAASHAGYTDGELNSVVQSFTEGDLSSFGGIVWEIDTSSFSKPWNQ